MRSTTRLVLILMLLTFSFICGFTYKDIDSSKNLRGILYVVSQAPTRIVSAITSTLSDTKTSDMQPVDTYWNVYNYMQSNYYGKPIPKPDQLTYSAIRGMFASLGDRYTRFLDPEEYKQMQQENKGDFEGIGAELDVKDGRVYIKRPIEKSPAEAVGLKPGDIILKVNDKLIQGLPIEEVVDKIRGQRGTIVRLMIKREDIEEPLEFKIKRDIIPFTIVESKMEDDTNKIGYIALRQFNEKSDSQFDKALGNLEGQGMRGLILDLRENPGGLLDVAVDIGSRFIEDGDIVIIKQGNWENSLTVEKNKHNHRMYPLVVLINGRSASASEILAGAIRDHKVGTIIGTDSFGKGLVQTIINVQGGSAVSITTAKYLTPARRDVNTEKIHPDIVIEPSDEDIKNENDVQLKRAVEVLKDKLGAKQANFNNAKEREKS